ncbi:hypothetical protein [Psychrobacillus sp.]|uniref:hypothetical protein n=1 Tax=Psychrobacillus sp. TaxID=1871623 RepID=UPI0028BE2185|nr:hypothetical protein [Psychrobacillus sp.]
MKKFAVLAVLFILLCSSLQVSAATKTEKVGASFVRSVAMSGAAATVNDVAYQYVILQGDPAALAVYKLPSKELVHEVKLPKSSAAWAITTDASGQAWIGGTPTAVLYSYNPVTKKLTNHGTPDNSHTSILDLEVVGNAIYGSTAPNGKVFKFEKGKFTTLGAATGVQKNARSIALQKGSNRLFVGSGSKASLIVWDLKTNAKKEILPPAYKKESDVYDLDFAGGYIFAKVSPSKKVLVFEASTNKFLKELPAGSRGVSPASPIDGNVYYSYMQNSSTSLYRFNMKTKSAEDMKVNLAGTEAVSLDFVKLASGETMLTGLLGNTGTHLLYNVSTNSVEISKLVLPEQSVPIHTIKSDEAGNIFTSGYVSGQVAILNPLDQSKKQILGIGQVEGMAPYDKGMYLGVYPAGDVMYYHPKTSPYGTTIFSVAQMGQNRPISLAVAPAEKMLAVGSHPKQGTVSGSFSYYNINTKKVSHRKALFPNQSVVALTYSNGYFYGGTSSFANSNPNGIGTAKFFRISASNVNAKPEELAAPIAKARLISAMATGPSSTIWGLADGSAFVYNPKTKKMQSISVVARTSGQIKNGSIVDGKDGYMYGTIENKLFRIHATSLKLEMLGDQHANGVALGGDGHIYFTTGGDVWRYKK